MLAVRGRRAGLLWVFVNRVVTFAVADGKPFFGGAFAGDGFHMV